MKRDKFKKNAASAGDVEACESGGLCAAFAGADHGDIGDVKFFYGVCGAEKEGVEKWHSVGGDGGQGNPDG